MDNFFKRVSLFQELFGLTNWNINIDEGTLEGSQAARTLADPRYHQATITITPQVLNNPDTYDDIIVHELIHIVMAMYDYFADNLGKDDTEDLFFIAREKSVSELTHIFMRIINEHYPENRVYRNAGLNNKDE